MSWLKVTHKDTPKRTGEAGQAMVEYVIAVSLAVLVLAVGNPSPLRQLLDSMRHFYSSYSFAVSLPALP